ncbi:MAG: HDOD domain-containing protein [Planctomycetota bacterium]|nr:HDOD domain-containing protein [Planctomycetota bacterium]
MSPSLALPLEVHAPLERYLFEHLELPILPEAAARILALCEDGNSDARDIQAVLERDPALASHVLRIANSAMFAPIEPIVSLQQAVSRLGMTAIRNLALAVSLQGRLFCSKQHEELTRQMWAHSALTAVYAREVARRLRRNGEVAFLWGLMHDVGRPLVLQAAIEKPELLAVDGEPVRLLEAAMDVFHAPVGSHLVKAWGLPTSISAVVASHHDPATAQEHVREARILRLADVLAHWALEEALDAEDFPRDEPEIAGLGLTDGDVSVLLGLRQQVLTWALAFG